MTRVAWALALGACTQAIDADSPCREVAYAIAARTVECTGDDAAADRRAQSIQGRYTCLAPGPEANGDDTASFVAPENLYHCAYTIRALSCAEVDAFGDDLEQWLTVSPICDRILVAVGP